MGNDSAHRVPQRSAADAVRLFQATLRAGDEPADRFDSRRDHHVAGVLHRSGSGICWRRRAEHCHRLLVPHPILTNEELAAIKHMDHRGWRTKTIDITFPRSEGARACCEGARSHLPRRPKQAIDEGYSLVDPVRPRDRTTGAGEHVAGVRRRASSFGAACQANAHRHRAGNRRSPRSASSLFAGGLRCRRDQSVSRRSKRCGRRAATADCSRRRFRRRRESRRRLIARRVAKGMLKVMGKMGISTLQSYKGAQIFEAVGLARMK